MIRLLLRTILPVGAMTLVACCVSGCNIASAVGYTIHPEPEFDAMYKLADVPTVVFIDDRRGRVNPTRLRRVIADEATTQIIEEEAVSADNMIAPRDAMLIARRYDRSGEIVPIAKVGELVGAQQVIYVDIEQFALTYDGVTPDPKCIARVRVLDLKTGKRVFPDPNDPDSYGYYQLIVDLPQHDPHGFNTVQVRNEMTEALALRTGDRLGEMFYWYIESELGGRLR